MKQNFLKIPINRILALILLDIMSIVVASFAALYIRFDFSFEGIPQEYLIKFENIIVYNIILTLLFFALWKLYKSVWRYASATELLNIVFATTCASIAQMILCHILNQKMPRSYYVIYWFLLFGLTTVIRFSYRILRLINSKRSELKTKKDGSNVMLIGAGAAANAILKEIETSRYLNLNPKCIIDDNPGCHGKFLRGVPIVGGRDKIADAVGQYNVDEIIFAIPSANTHVKKEILDICKETGCKMRTLPGMYQLINGDVSVAKLKEVEIEDLLGRDPIEINTEEVLNYVKDKVVLVTGGGGSIGSELCRQIAGHKPAQLIVFDIYENNACPRCGKIFPIEYIKNSDKVPLCDVCKSTVIHPGVYLHGEMLSNIVISHAVEEVAKADTILVLGMNLNSSLCKDMLPHFTGKDLIVIHKEPHYLDEKATAAYHGAVSEILPEVAETILDA